MARLFGVRRHMIDLQHYSVQRETCLLRSSYCCLFDTSSCDRLKSPRTGRCSTSVTKSHRSEAGIPSILDPASKEMISDPVRAGSVSHCRAPVFHGHLDHCVIILEYEQQGYDGIVLRSEGQDRSPPWRAERRFCFFRSLVGSSHVLCDKFLRTVKRNISNTKFHRSNAGNKSTLCLASKEMISDSVVLCETDDCFLHVQLLGTHVPLTKMHKMPAEVGSESSSAAFPTWKHCLKWLVSWMYEIKQAKRLSQALVHFVTVFFPVLFTDQRMLGLPMRATWVCFRKCFAHFCRGHRIQMCGHSYVGSFCKVGASSNFELGVIWNCVTHLSCVSK